CHDCDITGLLCVECLLASHRFMPFHRPSLWNGKHFQQQALHELGFMLPMGHNGRVCPHVHGQGGPQTIVIMDINGIHEVSVGWCRCAGAPTAAKQLFNNKLFPASMARPRTAFTFRVLKLFHMLNHVSRTTPWDFAGTMKRLTDNIDHQGVPDLYKTFKVVQRQWRIVRTWKRSGIRDPSTRRKPGGLVFPCVSCPLPGVNLDTDW
ncbi:hypothetical protein M422DRAFT_130893, partial [Sphaerobolus stellatus SS14]